MNLRPYQLEAVEAAVADLETVGSALIVMPTGCGKTVVFSHVADRFRVAGRVLVLAHRAELIHQAADKIGRVTGQGPEVEMAGQWADRPTLHGDGGHARVVVSSIQTQISGMGGKGRMSRFDPADFALVIVDEAHHATAKSYRKVLAHYRQNQGLKVLGVTATPDRADGTAMGLVFEKCSFKYEVLDAINDGWLAEPVQHLVSAGALDYSGIGTVAGDLNLGDLAALMESEGPMHAVAHPTFEHACGLPEGFIESIANREKFPLTFRPDWLDELRRQVEAREDEWLRTLVFTASVAQAESLADIFNRWRQGSSRIIHGDKGKIDDDERRKIFRDHKAGRFQFLVNCDVCTEGYDDPGLEMIAIAKPTKSRAKYCQMVGRGLRPLDGILEGLDDAAARVAAIAASGKPHCKVLDFVGNAGVHKLMTTLDVLGGDYSEQVKALAKKKIEQSDGMSPREALERSEEELERMRREAEERKAKEAAARASLVGVAHYKTEIINAFDRYQVKPRPVVDWMKDQRASRAQVDLLRRLGFADGAELSRVHAHQMIDALNKRGGNGQFQRRQPQGAVAR